MSNKRKGSEIQNSKNKYQKISHFFSPTKDELNQDIATNNIKRKLEKFSYSSSKHSQPERASNINIILLPDQSIELSHQSSSSMSSTSTQNEISHFPTIGSGKM